MGSEIDIVGALDVRTLGDALGIGVDLLELFGPDADFCGVWLGLDDGTMRDFVVCTEDRGRDVDGLLRYATLSVSLFTDLETAVLWRTVDDVTDGPALAEAFFEHGARLAAVGLQLLDEIAVRGDDLRSLAVTTFADAEGWDDVRAGISEALGADDGGSTPT